MSEGKTKMKNKIVRKLALGMVAFTLLASIVLVTGCDPQKIGGGNQLQPYSRLTGQYK